MSQEISNLFQYRHLLLTEEMRDKQPTGIHQQVAGQLTEGTSDSPSNADREEEVTPKDSGTKIVKETGLVKLPVPNTGMDVNVAKNPSMFTPLEPSKKAIMTSQPIS